MLDVGRRPLQGNAFDFLESIAAGEAIVLIRHRNPPKLRLGLTVIECIPVIGETIVDGFMGAGMQS